MISLQELKPLGVSIANLFEDEDYYSRIQVRFPAAGSRHDYEEHHDNKEDLAKRIEIALKLGAANLGKNLKSLMRLTRNEEKVIFKAEMKTLTNLLSDLVFYDDKTGGAGYAMRKELSAAFNQRLIELRNEAKDDLIIKGNGIPGLPYWATDGNLNQFWTGNDFEILAAIYRAEVEMFLSILADAHQFGAPVITTKPRSNKIKDEETTDSISQMGNQSLPPKPTSYQATQRRGRTFGYGTQGSSTGKRMTDIFGPSSNNFGGKSFEREPPPHIPQEDKTGKNSGPTERQGQDPPDPGYPSDDDDDKKDHSKKGRKWRDRPQRSYSDEDSPPNRTKAPEFDTKLKVDMIPKWDGNVDDLGRWMLKVNRLAERSPTAYKQLGVLVPTRFTDAADTWYYSLALETRYRLEENWGALRDAMGDYFMNRTYLNKQKIRANKAYFREASHAKESPSDYYIRKLDLLELVYDYNDAELINEIMSGAPLHWVSILTPHLYKTLQEFQLAIKFHEESLTRGAPIYSHSNNNNQSRFQGNREGNKNPFNQYRETRSNLVGWSTSTTNPPFPKDDANISPRGTPVSKGGRPCRHCGSDNHWDPECKYARKGEKRARVNAIQTQDPEKEDAALAAYEELYYGLETDDEDSDF